MRKCLALFGALSVFFCLTFLGKPALADSVDDLFLAKQWGQLDEFVALTGNSLSPREWSVYANGLWLQNRYDEALEILLRIQDDFPPSVRPFGKFYTALAFERTGQESEAKALLYKLWPKSPEPLRFYVAYALFRVEDGDEKEKWARAMLSSAYDDPQKVQALTALFSIKSAGLEEAFALLDLQPRNSTALSFLQSQDCEKDSRVCLYLGHAAFLNGDYRKAVEFLKKVDESSPSWKKAYYYRAYALYRLKNYEEAAALWGELAKRGGDYSVASVGRLATLARLGNATAIEILKNVAAPDGETARAALYHLISFYEDSGDNATAKALAARLLSGKDDFYSMKLLWRMGWKSWKEKDNLNAAEFFIRASTYKGDELWASRNLYWAARALEESGNTEEALKLKDQIKANYPLSYYGLLVENIEGKIREGLPEELQSKPSAMEAWGFLFWESRILSQKNTPSARFRASHIYEWLGNFDIAYNVVRSLEYSLKAENLYYRDLLKALYPTPFAQEVQVSCKDFNVDPHVVWAIMRQESAFNPNATSWVGASGLMQLMPATAKDEATKLKIKNYNIYSPDTNIRLGVAHFSWLIGRLEKLPLALAAYNAGIGNVLRWLPEEEDFDEIEWIEDIPFEETLTYVRKVLSNYKVYRALYGTIDERK